MVKALRVLGWIGLVVMSIYYLRNSDETEYIRYIPKDIHREYENFVEPIPLGQRGFGYKPAEPLPSEVKPEDEPRYNWITDNPNYDGDWNQWVEIYNSEVGDF